MRRPAVQDLLLGCFVALMQVQGTMAKPPEPGSRPLADLGHLGVGLLVASGLVLAVRRRWPVAVFVTSALLSLAYFVTGFTDGPGWIGLFVALYTLTAYGDGRKSLLIAGAGIAALAAGWLVVGADVQPRAAIGWVFFRIAASVMAAALGESVRSRRIAVAEAVERAAQAERTREEEARTRVDAERLRIAREVHDTVAHAIAVINVQAGVTAYMLDQRPDRAREALETIERTSAQALHEMRTVLGVLRNDKRGDDEEKDDKSLAQVHELAVVARDAGLDVKLDVAATGDLRPAVDATAYRIVQESITNVIRHVGPARVTVAIGRDADVLEVRVTNEGPKVAEPGQGRGITGMRERCELLGGDLTAGPRADGGFEVKALLPVGAGT
jgi:signal transduction histidine kinase